MGFPLLDIKAKTVSEGYTPLHLAACYLRHACKPCKSAAKPIDIIEQPETSDQPDTAEVVERSYTRTQSDTGTLELPKHKYRRRSSAPPLERQTSCKEIFEFLVERPEIDVCIIGALACMHVRKDRYIIHDTHVMIACVFIGKCKGPIWLHTSTYSLPVRQQGSGGVTSK